MKLLFLTLAIFLALESADRCWMDGTCRLVCKSDEQKLIRCVNRKRCCVLTRYLTIQPMTIDRLLPWTTSQPNSGDQNKQGEQRP
ncbi:beta-defensin 119 isoform X2 [Talpa occidentalis]|uniref:beta-defensin 119 isoform X2 n=1 Tax=Talpa occidentalis TaxID=50954 RepID=UPI001890A571|nr:beta-defensin 119 isoform X2 [Talpa occidentalis]